MADLTFPAPPAPGRPVLIDDGPDDNMPPASDPDVREPGAGAPSTLAEIRAELAGEVVPEERSWLVDTRPGYAVRFRTDITDSDFKHARKRSTMRGRRGVDGQPEIDDLKMGRIILGTYNTAILRRGTVVLDNDGDPLTFRSREFLELYGVATVADAIRAFYGTDGAVISAGRALMQASGWLDDPTEDDAAGPTGA